MARRARPRIPTHAWFLVRVFRRCALGGHEVGPGTWMRKRLGDYRQLESCEDCLKRIGIHRPSKSFTFSKDAPSDDKARQTGEKDE